MINDGMLSSKTDEWSTPQYLFDELKMDYLKIWGHTVFCNPPYGRQIGRWVEKASKEKCKTVMLLPARTDTKWFHKAQRLS